MPRTSRNLTVGSLILIVGMQLYVAECATTAPPALPPWKRMLAGEAKRRVEAYERRIAALRAAGDYAAAVELAEVILTIRRRIQGEDHYKTVDARMAIVREPNNVSPVSITASADR